MNRPYLFGPVDQQFAREHLGSHLENGACTVFDCADGLNVTIDVCDDWETICQRLPPDQRPEFVVLYLPYRTIPVGLWSAPIPIIGLAQHWRLLWHDYRCRLRRCDLVLTDFQGVEALHKEGVPHSVAANLSGFEQAFLTPIKEQERDIDILIVGGFDHAIHRERLPWLARIAQLADEYTVVCQSEVAGTEYRKRLARARIVFHHSTVGDGDKTAIEAVASGALLFQNAGNQQTCSLFNDGREAICYTADNYETLLRRYLDNENERRDLAAAGQRKAAGYSFASLWTDQLETIEEHWTMLVKRSQTRPQWSADEELQSRTWEAINCEHSLDPNLQTLLDESTSNSPGSATRHAITGLLTAQQNQYRDAHQRQSVSECFHHAVSADPDHIMARINLIEAMLHERQIGEAVKQAHTALTWPQRNPTVADSVLDLAHVPLGFNTFRVEWERAAFANAGCRSAEHEAKRQLIAWRLHSILGEFSEGSDGLNHYYDAAILRPDLPETRGALGCALGRAKNPMHAVSHLAAAVQGNPLDRQAARALFAALGETGDVQTKSQVARSQRLLAKIAPELCKPEPWFIDTQPAGEEMASIIILCCNEIQYTRQCLESVLRYSRRPFELILVDNGSTDGTADYLQEIAKRSEPNGTVIISNKENVGFPAGCNQGLAKARGTFLVFLNNDTIVTPNWLDRMVAWSLHEWPKTGLVGTVTNYSRPPQQITAKYRLEELNEFAASRAREYSRQALITNRLAGFCLLARRDVLQKIGDFDEQYGFGFFDDDDLSVRAAEAGFKLLVALDVFIHHFGSRTFVGLGVDTQKQLKDNFQRFHEKWGSKHSACYEMDKLSASNSSKKQKRKSNEKGPVPKVSLCMIVKNEEHNLPACLESVGDLVNEIIVVDTGSQDATKEVAAKMGAKVYDFPWIDHFSAARNESLHHATGKWIFWMDADDRVDDENRLRLKKLFDSLGDDNAAYVMKCKCLPDPVTHTATVVDHVRLFRNHPDIRWKYRIHEQILPSVRKRNGEVRWSDVVVNHTGYQDPKLRQRKLERDLRILTLEHQEQPSDPFTLFNLGSVYMETKRWPEALEVLQKSLHRSHHSDSIVRKLYVSIAQCQKQLGRREEAMETFVEGRRHYPKDTELAFREGILRQEAGDLGGAETCFLHTLESREENHFASVVEGIQGYKSRYHLAVIYSAQNRFAEAEEQWKAAVAEKPDFVAGWMGLGDLYFGQKRWADVEQTISQLQVLGAKMEHQVLRARLDAVREGDLASACKLLEATIREFPHELYPRVVLSELLIKDRNNWPAAENLLREILRMCPDHQDSRNRLTMIEQSKGAQDNE